MPGLSTVDPDRPRRARRPRKGGGFTLPELVLVIVLLAIMSAVATGSLESLSETRSGFAARAVQRDITFARQRACATGRPHWVVFDMAAQSYRVLVEDVVNPGLAGATALIDPATGRTFERFLDMGDLAGVRLVGASFDDETEVGFDWIGRPLSGLELPLAGEGEITFSNGYEVRIEPEAGLATLIGP